MKQNRRLFSLTGVVLALGLSFSSQAAQALLEEAKQRQQPIMVFVSNGGMTQIYSGLIGKTAARRVIMRAMLPALVVSYVVGVLFHEGRFNGWEALQSFNGFVFRIALASFAAYVLGQLLDIQVFDRIRQKSHSWWLAPAAASVFGQVLDTAAFFSIAFWHSSDAFMAANWVEIAMVDYVIKLGVSLLLFVPAYGVVLAAIVRSMKVQVTPATAIR